MTAAGPASFRLNGRTVRLLVAAAAALALFATGFPIAGPVLDSDYIERNPLHGHIYLSESARTHSHFFERRSAPPPRQTRDQAPPASRAGQAAGRDGVIVVSAANALDSAPVSDAGATIAPAFIPEAYPPLPAWLLPQAGLPLAPSPFLDPLTPPPRG